jgi:hypothetical protein
MALGFGKEVAALQEQGQLETPVAQEGPRRNIDRPAPVGFL